MRPLHAVDADDAPRRVPRGENRWPPTIAVMIAAVAYAALPESVLIAPRVVIPAVELALAAALVVTNPRRMVRQTQFSRSASILLAALVIAANLTALGLLVREVTRPVAGGGPLLGAAMQVWVTNVIGFALVFWEMDRGGPVVRRTAHRDDLPPADFRFSQDENRDDVEEVAASSGTRSGWVPTFVDYLYVSVTNSSAFSPTDTMPLSARAKALMAVEATAALLTTLLIIARAVGSLGGG